MNETTALTNTTTIATNDQAGKQKRGYMPWIALTVVLIGLAVFYSVGPRRRGNTMAIQQLSSFGDTADSVELGLNLKCNPSEQNDYGPNGCKDEDCAAENFVDGCKACMCFNNGNPSWCDGTRNEFYDTYFDQHGANPWGDRDRKNRKCNTLFRDPGSKCNSVWQCKNKKYLVCRHNECRYVDPFIYSVRGLWMMFDKALWKLRVTFCSYSSSCSSTQQLSSF